MMYTSNGYHKEILRERVMGLGGFAAYEFTTINGKVKVNIINHVSGGGDGYGSGFGYGKGSGSAEWGEAKIPYIGRGYGKVRSGYGNGDGTGEGNYAIRPDAYKPVFIPVEDILEQIHG